MTISLKAYCDNPPCTASTTHLRDDHVVAPYWVTANLADINGEWYTGSPAHAMHFCSQACLTAFLTVPEMEVVKAFKELTVEFTVDESRLTGNHS